MCGFTGELSFNNIDNSLLKRANKHSVCRGPDNLTNHIENGNINMSLWFNRLAIIDLSEKANQPMISEDSNSILMFKIFEKNLMSSTFKSIKKLCFLLSISKISR